MPRDRDLECDRNRSDPGRSRPTEVVAAHDDVPASLQRRSVDSDANDPQSRALLTAHVVETGKLRTNIVRVISAAVEKATYSRLAMFDFLGKDDPVEMERRVRVDADRGDASAQYGLAYVLELLMSDADPQRLREAMVW